MLQFNTLFHFVSTCCTVAVQRTCILEWNDGRGRTRTNPERKSSYQLDTVTIEICLYQNKLPKIVPQIQSYDKYLQRYMREAARSQTKLLSKVHRELFSYHEFPTAYTNIVTTKSSFCHMQ